MSPTFYGIAGLVLLIALMLQRMPVAFAMMAVGLIGIGILNSTDAAFATLVDQAWVVSSYYELTVIPLFVLMGNVASQCGMSRDLYAAAHAWVGHLRGGLASATIIGCTGFAALSGSSVASALTLGRVALPEMKRYKYDVRLATGVVAAGGTLGILIPPSTGFVIYAILTEESVGRLFLAGVFPGLLLAGLFILTVYIQTLINPALGPRSEKASLKERGSALLRATSIIAIIVVTIGGIYLGVFTPVEASAVGAALAIGVALWRRSLSGKSYRDALLQTVRTTMMVFAVILGASLFSPFLALTNIPSDLATTLTGLQIGPIALLFIILFAFILLGTFLDGFAMMVLILPIVLPIIEQSQVPAMLGLAGNESDLQVWFGVVMVIVLEMALISPPVGMNVFVVKAVAEDVPMKEIYKGVLPFWCAMIVCLVLLVAFPEIALFLPKTMFGP
jgi:tripartite ATP-independent transporter DctM subunit